MSWLSSLFSSGKKAAQATQNATDQTLALQKQMYDQTRSDYMPFRQAGLQTQNAFLQGLGQTPVKYNFNGSGNQMGTLTAEGTDMSSDPLAGFYQSGYGSMFKDPQLMQRTNTAFSAKGMGLDGSAVNAMYKNMNDDQYGRFSDYMAALNGVTNAGQSATGNVMAANQNMANNSSSALQQNAQNLASSYGRQASDAGNALNTLGKIAGWFF